MKLSIFNISQSLDSNFMKLPKGEKLEELTPCTSCCKTSYSSPSWSTSRWDWTPECTEEEWCKLFQSSQRKFESSQSSELHSCPSLQLRTWALLNSCLHVSLSTPSEVWSRRRGSRHRCWFQTWARSRQLHHHIKHWLQLLETLLDEQEQLCLEDRSMNDTSSFKCWRKSRLSRWIKLRSWWELWSSTCRHVYSQQHLLSSTRPFSTLAFGTCIASLLWESSQQCFNSF